MDSTIVMLDVLGVALPPGWDGARLARAAGVCVERAQRFARPEVPWQEVSIYLQGDAENRATNRRILGHDYPTDVITQAYEPFPFEPPGLTGELFVNVDQARRVAEGLGRLAWHEELLLYVAHGCDHLTGADDATPAGRRLMRRRDLRWMRAAVAACVR